MHGIKHSAVLRVKEKSWYKQWRHTVFAFVGHCIENEASRILLVGLKGDVDINIATMVEWPSLAWDLSLAFRERKYPLNQGCFDMITEIRIPFSEFQMLVQQNCERADSYIIVASCPTPLFQPVKDVVRASGSKDRIFLCWGQSDDIASGFSSAGEDIEYLIDETQRMLENLQAKKRILDKLQQMKGFPPDVSQSALLEIVDGGEEVEVPAGELIFQEGEDGQHFYVLFSGSLAVLKNGEKVHQYSTQGEFFGEQALLSEDSKRQATVKTETAAELFVINRKTFEKLTNLYPAIQILAGIYATDSSRNSCTVA